MKILLLSIVYFAFFPVQYVSEHKTAKDLFYQKSNLNLYNQGPQPKSPARNWFSIGDIPDSFKQKSISTTISYRLIISKTGKISKCSAVDSSDIGLEQIVCERILVNADFSPALNEVDEPTEGIFEGKFNISYDVKIVPKKGCNHIDLAGTYIITC